MNFFRHTLLTAFIGTLFFSPTLFAQSKKTAASVDADPQAIAALNARLDEAGRRLDNDAVMSLWAEDGVDLLPGLPPMIGKKAIAAWLAGVKRNLAGVTVKLNQAKWGDITVTGNFAFAWCSTHQIVQPPAQPGLPAVAGEAAPPPLENYGKMLLVLRRAPDGRWLILREMWTSSTAPKQQHRREPTKISTAAHKFFNN